MYNKSQSNTAMRFSAPVYFHLFILFTLFGGCDDIFEKDISNEKVVIVAPQPGAVAPAGTQLFVWEKTEGATSYRLRIVSPSFEAAAICLVDTLVTAIRFAYPLPAGEYEWSLKACNGAWSTVAGKYPLTLVEKQEDE